jgi:hypothetical protein
VQAREPTRARSLLEATPSRTFPKLRAPLPPTLAPRDRAQLEPLKGAKISRCGFPGRSGPVDGVDRVACARALRQEEGPWRRGASRRA